MAIYTIVIAAAWKSTGFVMALFLAGLRGIDDSIIKAAKVDGASLPRIYRRIIIPSLRPVFLSAVIILLHLSIKSFDLVIVLTRGGPGYSTDMPATFMYAFAFNRARLAFGAASAVMMLVALMAIIIPYLYSELRATRNAK
ncbi:Melibiose/raffinose/stachyose import permease protein MelD [subsurface metagenome]